MTVRNKLCKDCGHVNTTHKNKVGVCLIAHCFCTKYEAYNTKYNLNKCFKEQEQYQHTIKEYPNGRITSLHYLELPKEKRYYERV